MTEDKQKQQEPKQEVTLEDLPVDDEQQDNVKGGLSFEDKLMSVM